MDAAKDVQGVGVFMEFRRPGATTQFMLFPDGYDSTGKIIDARFARRTVTLGAPKKQWRMASLPTGEVKAILDTGMPLQPINKDSVANNRLTNVATLMNTLLTSGWELVNKPILVEVSKKDLDDIRLHKTPSKLMYRVNQCKIALGYPTSLVN